MVQLHVWPGLCSSSRRSSLGQRYDMAIQAGHIAAAKPSTALSVTLMRQASSLWLLFGNLVDETQQMLPKAVLLSWLVQMEHRELDVCP